MARPTTHILKSASLVLLLALVCNMALADSRQTRRRGKVIIIRGALTVFSLGMNGLGDKLARYGLDVDVIADISAGRATSQLVSEYRRNRNMGPIIFIGHSRGAQLGPKQARVLQRYKIPVRLIVMVDNVHQTTVPSNVERCVNLYQSNTLGVLDGEMARAESKNTEMINRDIDQIRSRSRGGLINHFNIDSSPWIHELVVAEVLKVCPEAGSRSSSNLATTGTASRSLKSEASKSPKPTVSRSRSAETKSQPMVAQKRSKSGLQHPSTVAGGLWARSTTNAVTPPSSSTRAPSQRATSSRGSSRSYRSNSSRSQRSTSRHNHTTPRSSNATSSSRSRTSRSRSSTRTAKRPPASQKSTSSNKTRNKSSAAQKPESPQPKAATAKKPSDATDQKTNQAVQMKVSG